MSESLTHTKCIHCGSGPVATIDSRHGPETPWRRRRKRCMACKVAWSTYEVPVDVLDGLRELHYYIGTMKSSIDHVQRLLSATPLLKADEAA